MPRGLRSILGTSGRVHKRRRRPRPAPDSLPPDDWAERLPDQGPITQLLLLSPSLHDVPQAMRLIRRRMFSPLPTSPSLPASRAAHTLRQRAAIPPLVTAAHLLSVLGPPSAVEREVAALRASGHLRTVRVPRRGALGEALIEAGDLDTLLDRSTSISVSARDKLRGFLREQPAARSLGPSQQHGLSSSELDELVRAGFLARGASQSEARPERTASVSVEQVARHASGTVGAVGGRDAVHLAGGGGGFTAGGGTAGGGEEWRIAVPGHGRYMKLAEETMGWLRETLGARRWGEGTEAWLRERFEGGGGGGTRWREFWGVEWEWVLGEAVGLGVVEVFDTGSVGRGVRGLGC